MLPRNAFWKLLWNNEITLTSYDFSWYHFYYQLVDITQNLKIENVNNCVNKHERFKSTTIFLLQR